MSKVKILFFAADPLSAPPDGRTARLLLDEDVRQIRQKVRAAEHRDALEFDFRLAVRTDDLLQALNETRPQVVHFSGHGGNAGLVLVGSHGRPHLVPAAALTQLFQVFRGDIRLAVLNACFSLPQAKAIARVVGCAIGTRREISDTAAITFGASFYRALAFGHSVQVAFDQARTALAMDHPEDERCPQLVSRPDVDPAGLVLVTPASGAAGSTETEGPERADETGPDTAPVRGRRMGRVGMTIAGLALAGAAVVAMVKLTGRSPGSQGELPACGRGGGGSPRTLVYASALPAAASTTDGDPSGAEPDLAAAKALYRVGNHAAAFPLFKRAAEAGNPEAMGFLGAAYLHGRGTERRPDLAFHWLHEAAEKRDARGMNELGVAYQNGEGVDRSVRWARYWYQAAVEKGYVEAMLNLGSLYRDEGNYDSALFWYRAAVSAGSLDGRVDAGMMYQAGLGVPRDPEVARCLYRTAAGAGSPRGMLAMGRVYQEAIGVPRDYAQAREWYLKAVRAGSADAMYYMGVLYQNGWGVPRNHAEANRWYRRARDAGSRIAAGNLATPQAS